MTVIVTPTLPPSSKARKNDERDVNTNEIPDGLLSNNLFP